MLRLLGRKRNPYLRAVSVLMLSDLKAGSEEIDRRDKYRKYNTPEYRSV
jgi:hypothetical protein